MATQSQTPTSPLRASNLQRAWLCPPAPWREAAVPAAQSPEAAEGALLHAAVAQALGGRGERSGLDEEQRRVVEACLRFLEPLAREAQAALFERPLELLDETGRPILERQITPDAVLFRGGGEAAVIDWKTGRAEPAFPAQLDLQLCCYALAVRNAYEGVEAVEVHRFHPRLPVEQRHSCARFAGGEAYWRELSRRLRAIVKASRPQAPARPGSPQCLLCRAKPVCAEFRAWAEGPIAGLPAPPVPRELTPERLAELLAFRPRLEALTRMMAEAEQLARQALAQGVALTAADGSEWMLRPGAPRRAVTDAARARRALEPYLAPEAFDAACTVQVGRLEAVLRASTGLRWREAAELLATALGGLLENREAAPSLVRVNPAAPALTQTRQSGEEEEPW